MKSYVNTEPARIREYFDEISSRYDGLNRVLSFGLDRSWRRKACRLALTGGESSLLDLGTGTGRFLADCLSDSVRDAWGLDFSENMLRRARRRSSKRVRFVRGDFHRLPFAGERFDAVVSAFALRSVSDMPRFAAEIHRVLKASGKTALLCLTRPRSAVFRWVHDFYVKFLIPSVGRLLTGSRAYEFLSESVRAFPEPEATAAVFRSAGFQTVEIHRMTAGAVTLIVARK
jgi:demethylmenaquinone methyltransferase/2-methoxy-6-polyprenyl-1,4-benzoquinol methylase